MSLDFAVGPQFVNEATATSSTTSTTSTTTTTDVEMLMPRVRFPETINVLPDVVLPGTKLTTT